MNEDVILCSFNGVTNLVSFHMYCSGRNFKRSLLRDLNAEKNMIQETTEKFLNLFTLESQKEIQEMRTEFESTMKEYNQKIKVTTYAYGV